MSRSRSMTDGPERLGRRGFLAGLALVSVGALAACSSGGGQPSSSGNSTPASGTSGGGASASSSSATVKMTDQNKFDPDSVTISKGGTVTWQNASSTVHTATFDPSKVANKQDVSLPSGVQPFDSGLIQAGQSWSHTFTDAGTYHYTCIPHESVGMHGTVIVQ